jgi:hypothetical protein
VTAREIRPEDAFTLAVNQETFRPYLGK